MRACVCVCVCVRACVCACVCVCVYVTKERLAARENYKNHLNIRKFAFPTTTVRSVKTMVISGDVSFRLLSPFLANRQNSDWQLPDHHAMAAKTASQQVGRQKVSAEDERKKERGENGEGKQARLDNNGPATPLQTFQPRDTATHSSTHLKNEGAMFAVHRKRGCQAARAAPEGRCQRVT